MTERTAPVSASLIPLRPRLRAVERRVLALDCAVFFDEERADGVTIAAFADLNAGYLAQIAPELVVLPLFSIRQDAMTMVEALMVLGYGGAISVMAPRLPDRAMVEAELRALGPGLRLRLVSPTGETPPFNARRPQTPGPPQTPGLSRRKIQSWSGSF